MTTEQMSIQDLYATIQKRNRDEFDELTQELASTKLKMEQIKVKIKEVKSRPGFSKREVISQESTDSGESLSERVLSALSEDPIGIAELSDVLEVKPNLVSATLKSLVAEGKAIVEGKGRGQKFRLA